MINKNISQTYLGHVIYCLCFLGIDTKTKVQLDTKTLSILHSPPDSSTWRAGSEEKGYGIPPLNYALGWYTLDIDNKEGLLWHPGSNSGFIAQVVVDPERKNAVLLATNVRASHSHLFNAPNRIKAHYSPVADLPGIEKKTATILKPKNYRSLKETGFLLIHHYTLRRTDEIFKAR